MATTLVVTVPKRDDVGCLHDAKAIITEKRKLCFQTNFAARKLQPQTGRLDALATVMRNVNLATKERKRRRKLEKVKMEQEKQQRKGKKHAESSGAEDNAITSAEEDQLNSKNLKEQPEDPHSHPTRMSIEQILRLEEMHLFSSKKTNEVSFQSPRERGHRFVHTHRQHHYRQVGGLAISSPTSSSTSISPSVSPRRRRAVPKPPPLSAHFHSSYRGPSRTSARSSKHAHPPPITVTGESLDVPLSRAQSEFLAPLDLGTDMLNDGRHSFSSDDSSSSDDGGGSTNFNIENDGPLMSGRSSRCSVKTETMTLRDLDRRTSVISSAVTISEQPDDSVAYLKAPSSSCYNESNAPVHLAASGELMEEEKKNFFLTLKKMGELEPPSYWKRPMNHDEAFIRKCEELHISPRPAIAHHHHRTLSLKGYRSGARLMEAVSESVKRNGSLVALEVPDNGMCDQGCKAIAAAITENKGIDKLNIARNRIRDVGIDAVSKSLPYLTRLNLGGNILDQTVLARFIRSLSSGKLTSLNLSRTGMGKMAGESLATMLPSYLDSLEELDISWNSFQSSTIESILVGVEQNATLTHLNMSWNRIGEKSVHLCTLLEKNKTLRVLDLSHTNIDEQGATCIASGLHANHALKMIKLDGNTIGELGLSSLLEVMHSRGIRSCDMSLSCCTVIHMNSNLFDVLHPYKMVGQIFDLSDPYQRSVAMAMMRMDQVKKSSLLSMPNTELPKTGTLDTHFMKFAPTIQRNADNSEVRFISDLVHDSMKRLGGMGHCNAISLLRVACQFWLFSWMQLRPLLSLIPEGNVRCELIASLFPWVKGRTGFEKFAINILYPKTVKDLVTVCTPRVYSFDGSTPTGFYSLDLEKPVHRDLCYRLLSMSYQEKKCRENLGDASQKGNREHFRNEKFNGAYMTLDATWPIPESGILEFVFVSSVPSFRPGSLLLKGVADFDLFCHGYMRSLAKDVSKYLVRTELFGNAFTSAQAIKLISIAGQQEDRVIIAATLYSMVTDRENLFSAMDSLLSPSDVAAIIDCIGYLSVWNPAYLERTWKLDLSVKDERVVADVIMRIANYELGVDGLVIQLNGEPSTVSDLTSATQSGLPTNGILSFTYPTVPNPDHRLRKKSISCSLLADPRKVEEFIREEEENAVQEAKRQEIQRRKMLSLQRKQSSVQSLMSQQSKYERAILINFVEEKQHPHVLQQQPSLTTIPAS